MKKTIINLLILMALLTVQTYWNAYRYLRSQLQASLAPLRGVDDPNPPPAAYTIDMHPSAD